MRESEKTPHPSFEAILSHLSGREDATVGEHVGRCASCAEAAEGARRLLAAGRQAAAAPALPRRALRRAEGIFRDARSRRAPTILELVFDSFLRPATAAALRTTATMPRFLRFAGRPTVEIEVREGGRGVDLRGQITPRDFSREVLLVAGRQRVRAPVGPDGTFLLRGVTARRVEIRVGPAVIPDLDL